MTTDAAELARRLAELADFYSRRPCVDEQQRTPLMQQISRRECLDIAVTIRQAIPLLTRLETAERAMQVLMDKRIAADERRDAAIRERDEALSRLAEAMVTAEYDCPGDAPEFCGFYCQLCHGSGDTAATIAHEKSCILASRTPAQGEGE